MKAGTMKLRISRSRSLKDRLTQLIAGLLVVSALPLSARPPDSYMDRRWRMEDGLPQNTVSSIVQAADGRIWVGTRAGLASFDGARFRVFDRLQLPELESSVITDLYLDRVGDLWVGTFGAGALKLRLDDDVTVIERIGEAQNLQNLRVAEILERPGGELWLGTLGSGCVVRSTDGRLEVWGELEGKPTTVIALEPGSDGEMWIGSDQGLWLHRDDGSLIHWADEDLRSSLVRDLTRDEDGTLWMTTDRGLVSLDVAGVLRAHEVGARGLPTIAVQVGRAGELWVGTLGGGIYVSKLDRHQGPGSASVYPDSGHREFHPQEGLVASDQTILAFHQDEAGRLWYGTLADGLNRLDQTIFSIYGPAHGLPSSIVTAVLGAEDGSVWVATRNAGLSRWHNGSIHGLTKSLGHEQGLDSTGVWSMVFAASGGLWVGTDGRGLYHLVDGEARQVPLPGLHNARIFALAPGLGRDLWIGTNEGLVLWVDADADAEQDGANLKSFGLEDGLPGLQTRSLLFDSHGRLWIGTVDGLGLLEGGRIRTWKASNETIEDTVFGLYEDSRGAIWVGTFGRGVLRIEDSESESPRVQSLSTREGLFSDQIATIREDQLGYVWLGSPQGLARVERRDLERSFSGEARELPQLLWGKSDGLTGGGVWGAQQSSTLDTQGDLWLATHQGLARLSPTDIRSSPAPEVRVDRVSLGGRLVPPAGLAVVPMSTRGYVIEYSVPMPFSPEKTRIRYRLVGFDQQWNDGTDQWSKSYTRLPPGRYTFEIQASDESGRFKGEPTVFSFRVEAGFTSTWWFWGICGFGAILLAFGFHRWRVARLERRRQKLATRVEEALQDVAVLDGLLPICGTCRKVRDDQGYWTQVEAFLDSHSEASFTHGLCPSCAEQAMRELEETAPAFRSR